MRSHAAAVLLLVAMAAPAAAGPAVTPLVSTQWLADNLTAEDLTVVEIRPVADYLAGHIPGSAYTAYPGIWQVTREGIVWQMPEVPALESAFGALGIDGDTSVVLVPAGTDVNELGAATWIYWVLKHTGHDAVAILDGGWAAWRGEGRASEAGPPWPISPATYVASLDDTIFATTDYVASRLGTGTVIVDARPVDQYRGTAVTSTAGRVGHIPGALNIPTAVLFDTAAGRLKPIAGLEAELPPQLSDRSVDVITYCNTGHWGSIDWFVLHELLGFADVRLYDGSMAAWGANTSLPLEISQGEGPPLSRPGIS